MDTSDSRNRKSVARNGPTSCCCEYHDLGFASQYSKLLLSQLYGGLVINDPVAFSMLLDTAFYIFDGA